MRKYVIKLIITMLILSLAVQIIGLIELLIAAGVGAIVIIVAIVHQLIETFTIW